MIGDKQPRGLPLRRAVLVLAGLGLAGLAVSFSFPAAARSGKAPPPLNEGPMIRLEERKWDFGQVPQYSDVKHSFRFRSTGTAPLKILRVEPDCGCTVASSGDSILAPGDSSSIRVVFSTKNYEDAQKKIVAVFTNDPAEPRIDLILSAMVKPFVRISPRILDFGQVKRGQTPAVSTQLTADSGQDFKVIAARGGENAVTWKISPLSSEADQTFELEARLRPDAPLGPINERVHVEVQHPRMKDVSVSLRGVVYSYFLLPEARINFATLGVGKSATRSIKIEADGSKPYRITSATTSASFLQPVLTEEGKGYSLAVTLNAPDETTRFEVNVVLQTTDPAQPEIKVGVRGVVLE